MGKSVYSYQKVVKLQMQPQKIADVIQLLEPPQEVMEAHSIHMIKW